MKPSKNDRLQTLINPQDQAFKVFTFRMVNVYGMVGALTQTVYNADVAATFNGCRKYGLVKRMAVYNLRAAKGKQQAAFFYFL